ncbi:lysozyme [Henriciella marina]|uniref:lysozyme n=1 Tax=Henriciella marina TaxID=453851 RepID=UPI00036C13A9|nr:lysozyme [Henriciella marina]
MSELRTSDAGLELIKAYEGFRSDSRKLADGRWVIGYGHTKAAREGLTITEAEAQAILSEFDLPPIEEALNELLLVPVTQNEFDALVSFAFNIGLSQFESSDVLASINANNKLKAAWAMESWRKARVGQRDMVVDPLVRRRADEKALFLKTDGPVPHASSSRFRPLVDIEETDRYRKQAQMAAFQSPGYPANDQVDEEISTEAAARHVKDRLTRILGEDQSDEEAYAAELATDLDDATEDGEKSVDDIRAAVSALAVNTAPEEDLAEDAEAEAAADPVAEPETEIDSDTESDTSAKDDAVFTMSADNDAEEAPVAQKDEERPSPFDLLVPAAAQAEASEETETDDATDADEDESDVSAAAQDDTNEPSEDDLAQDAEIVETPVAKEAVAADAAAESDESDKAASAHSLKSDDFDVENDPLTLDDLDEIEEGETKDERGRILIDDLRPSDVWLSEGRDDDEEKKEGPLETLLFGVLALVGAGLFTYGGASEFGWFGMERPAQADMMAYLPPFLMLLGGLVFVVMAYYCFKALFPGKK